MQGLLASCEQCSGCKQEGRMVEMPLSSRIERRRGTVSNWDTLFTFDINSGYCVYKRVPSSQLWHHFLGICWNCSINDKLSLKNLKKVELQVFFDNRKLNWVFSFEQIIMFVSTVSLPWMKQLLESYKCEVPREKETTTLRNSVWYLVYHKPKSTQSCCFFSNFHKFSNKSC